MRLDEKKKRRARQWAALLSIALIGSAQAADRAGPGSLLSVGVAVQDVQAGELAHQASGRDVSGIETATAEASRVSVVFFSAAWCSVCKIMKPRLANMQAAFAEAPVQFETFDFTFGSRKKYEARAERLGLGEFYKEYKGATGFAVVVDVRAGEVLDVLTVDRPEGVMRASLAQALARAARRASSPPAEARARSASGN